jgi:putative ABC transport system permease protein
MLQNYLTTGLRALNRNRVFAAINILGLAIGMAACILLLLFVRYETSFDQWLPEHERAYQIQRFSNDPGEGQAFHTQSSAHIVGRTLAKDFPEIEKLAYVSLGKPVVLQNGQASTGWVAMADPEILDIVKLPFVKGNPATAMKQRASVLLTQREAAKRFPGHEPMGQTITMVRNGRNIDYQVTGILKDIPKNSQFNFDMLVPYDREAVGFGPAFYTNFGWNSGHNYVRLRQGADVQAMTARLDGWKQRNIPKPTVPGGYDQAKYTTWSFVPLADVHLAGADDGMTPINDPKTIATFALIAVLILVMACINFTNLATARAGLRAREVALRKVMGASRQQLIVQFLGESLLVAAIAIVVALAIVELTVPGLADFLKADLSVSYLGPHGVLLPVVGLVLIVGLVAGLYPAFVLSHFDPAPVLKSNRGGADTQGSGRLRSALVVLQFVISIALMICTAVVTAQTIYARKADNGYDRAGLLQVTGIGRKQLEPVAETLVEAVRQIPGVEAVGRTNLGIDAGNSSTTFVRLPGNPTQIGLGIYNVDTGFFEAMGMKLLAGRNFSRSNPRDFRQMDLIAQARGEDASEEFQRAFVARGINIVINAAAVERLGFASPAAAVGQTIDASIVDDTIGFVPATIVGVVPTIQVRNVRNPEEPIMYYYDTSYITDMAVRVKASEAGAVRDRIETVWKRYAPQVPFEAQFADELVARQYDADEARAKTFAAFAGLAIIVACLGLYGLAAFTAERRTREIGIRKVLGAKTADIVRLLVWQFSRPVLLANIIAWPVAWWLMRDWLDGFANRIDLGPWWFIGAGALAAAIAAATIISHALRVARQSPALALRYE